MEERQIDIRLLLDQYQQILISLTSKNEICLATLIEGIALLTRTLQVKNSSELQELFAKQGLITNLMKTIELCRLPAEQKRTILPVVINRVSLLLRNCLYAQQQMEKEEVYNKLFEVVIGCGPTDYNTLHAILSMSTYGEDPSVGGTHIKNIQPIKKLLKWLTETEYENHDQQVWLTESLHNLCIASIQNKMLCCHYGLIKDIVDTLCCHERLQKLSAEFLLKLIEILGQHSLSAEEMKILIKLLQNGSQENEDDVAQFPYKSHIIHIISSIAKGDGFEHCRQYFDIQESTDGISVPSIREWASPVFGFTFHAWVRLDPLAASHGQIRRQLYCFYTNSGTGLEAFFIPNGTLVVATAYKKEFLATKLEDCPILDEQWHSITICQAAGKRPFGVSQLVVYIDGAERKTSSLKYPGLTEPFAYCQIGSELVRANATSLTIDPSSKLSIRDNIKDAIKSSVPGVFALPQYLKPANNDPNVQWTMVGMEEIMWGKSSALHGQLGLIYVFEDSLTANQVRILHNLGSNKTISSEQVLESQTESTDIMTKMIFNYSSRVCSNFICTNLAPSQISSFDGHTIATPFSTYDAKDVINCLGGIQVLFPLLETSLSDTSMVDSSYLSLSQEQQSRSFSVESENEWEMLPSSSFSDWKLEKNPVSGFLTLIKNLTINHPVNQEQLMRGGGVAIIGSLLQKIDATLIDVNVLMASQLFVELATSTKQTKLLYQFNHSILFDFRIWSRSEFHMQIGHIQYIATLVMADRKYFRKKFGVQFLLDVVRQHYTDNANSVLSREDNKTIRASLFGLVKFFLQKEVNAKEVSALTNFIMSYRKSEILEEILDVLIQYMESKLVKDQMFLLLLEPKCIDLIYCLLLDESLNQDIRSKVYKLIFILLKSNKVSNRHKTRLHLQEAGYLGFVYMRSAKEPQIEMEEVVNLTNHMLSFDHPSSYQGILALCHHLYLADIDIKLELARKILTLVYSYPHAPSMISRQIGWQGCIARLLVKEMVQPELDSVVSIEDVVSMADDDTEEAIDLPSPTHYINKVTDTAKQFLPEHAGNTVDKVGSKVGNVADEASKVLGGATLRVRSNLFNATEKMTSTVYKTQNIMNDTVQSAHLKVHNTVKTANSLLETVGDITHIRKKRPSIVSLDSGLHPVHNPQFLQNYNTYEFERSVEDHPSTSVSSEDISQSRETICSSPTRTQDSISEDDAISFDMEHFNSELESLTMSSQNPTFNKEEELVQMVTNILFTVLWRGKASGKQKREIASSLSTSQGQVIASINMLALSNKLYASHAYLKRKLTELCLQAILSDLKEKNQVTSEQAQLARHMMENAYDLVVLDDHEDFSKKVSEALLDGILGILDGFVVFQEGQSDAEWGEMAKMAFDILLACAENTKDLEFCAIATAKLHSLVQTRLESSTEETGFLIYRTNKIIREALKQDNTDHYAFLVPIMKALLDKGKIPLELTKQLPSLNLRQSGCEFFTHFQVYCLEDEWEYFITKKVSPLHDAFTAGFLQLLRDKSNVYWAECYEEAKISLHKRNREIGESKLQFNSLYSEPFKQRLKDESNRYHNVMTQQKSNQVFVQKRWRIMKRLFFGPRGAWNNMETLEDHWMLGSNENLQRMRMKLVPNPNFDNHADASAQRDNVKKPSESFDNLLQHQIAVEAVNTEISEEESDLTEEDLKSIAKEQMKNNQENSEAEQDQEKFIMSEECELVTLMSVVKGRFELTNNFIYFFDSRPVKDEEERYDNRWSIQSIWEVHLRRFNLRRSALELFLLDHTNFFLNFASSKRRNKVFTKIISQRPPNMIYNSARSPKELLKASGLSQKWVNREISNFEYLMHLNTIAGRSYNDLSQYPIFPWILADYTSETLDLGNSATFRDLSKPMGVQNEKHSEEIRQKYENFEDPSGAIAKFHYGTHYSNSAMVLHYLVRVEPFTTHHIQLQSGRFDVADRQFHSIPQAWKSLMNNINDVKELIPEFFFFPDFLLNHNYFDLGKLQGKKQSVNDVILPKWATSVDDFIRQHRNALESEYVSAHLHEWVDLIFGFKQKGRAAEEAMNVFYYCCYEGAVNLDAITDPAEREALEGMIQNFGQVPCQLMKEPHPSRIPFSEHRTKLMKAEYKRPDVLKYPTHWRPYCVELSTDKNPLVFIQHPENQIKSILQYGAADSLITISSDGTIGHHNWLPYDRNLANYFYFEKDPSIQQNSKTKKKLPGPFIRGIVLKPRAFAVTPDAKYILYGGSWDCSMRVYSLSKAKEVCSSIRHTDIITCLAIDKDGLYSITGSKDTTAIVWELSNNKVDGSVSTRSVQVLYGHDKPVTTVAISICLDIALSGSKDGTVNIHTVKDGQYLKTLRPPSYDPTFTIEQLTLSHQGHTIFTGHNKDSHSLHVFTLNGRHLSSVNISHRITGLISSGDWVLCGDENGDLTLRDLYTMNIITSMPLQLPIQTLALTQGNSHILAPLRDGKVIVVGLAGIPEYPFQ
eukprot:TRINITY_DN363_c0_g1_i1.p1 TRINITY_DN363_c0_g1~~TRINITY_DN363_c0_g1_i1.p1  ORF type:complete len:2732 (-),score=430.45 TRINITY_DN363_c0_g1_i1:184-7587(-)